MNLTDKDKQTLVAILRFVENQHEDGIGLAMLPSVRDLMPMIDALSTSTVNYRLRKLMYHGLVAPSDGKNRRSTRLTDAGLEMAQRLLDRR